MTSANVNQKMYLHEIIRTVPGREEPYLASVMSLHYDPTRGKHRDVVGAFGQFRSIDTSGAWPVGINIWENTWRGQTDDLISQFQDAKRDVAMEEWWNRNLHLRRGGYDRMLIPAPFSPTRADLRARDVRSEIVLHDIMWLPFGEPARFLDTVERTLVPALDRLGLDLLGAFRVAMRPRQVLTLIGAPRWDALGAFFEAGRTDADLRQWNEYRDATVMRSEELLLLPARHDALTTGR